MKPTKGESIDAHDGGGSSSISDEGPVMGLERRGWASSRQAMVNPAKVGEEPGFFLRRLETVRFQENGWQEPYESRGSRGVLWGPGGEIPPGYSTLNFCDFADTFLISVLEFYWHHMEPIIFKHKITLIWSSISHSKLLRINSYLLFLLMRWIYSQLLKSFFAEVDTIFH